MIYKSLYLGEVENSQMVAVAKIDGNKVDVIFADTDLLEDKTVYNLLVFNLEIESPAQWEEYVECDRDVWIEFYEKLTNYTLSIL